MNEQYFQNYQQKSQIFNNHSRDVSRLDEVSEYQGLVNQRPPNKIKFPASKHRQNPKEELKQLDAVYISKKANYIDTVTCGCCVGQNVYKIYKYQPESTHNEEKMQDITSLIALQAPMFKPKQGRQQMEGGEKDKRGGGTGSPIRRGNAGGGNSPPLKTGFQPPPPLVNQSFERKKGEPFIQPKSTIQPGQTNKNNASLKQSTFKQDSQIPQIQQNNQQQYQQNEIIQNPYQPIKTTQGNLTSINESIDLPKHPGVGKKKKGKRVLKIDEDSVLCPRIYCPANRRPFTAYTVNSNSTFEYARMQRDFKFTFLCLQRPEILVYRTEFVYSREDEVLNQVLIGKVVQPLSCLKQVHVYEMENGSLKMKYDISTNCCSIGLFCLKFGKIRFMINELSKNLAQLPNDIHGDDREPQKPSKPGKIVKQWSRCLKECYSKGGHYKVRFPQGSTVDQKILLMTASMMIDYQFFDRQGLLCCF